MLTCCLLVAWWWQQEWGHEALGFTTLAQLVNSTVRQIHVGPGLIANSILDKENAAMHREQVYKLIVSISPLLEHGTVRDKTWSVWVPAYVAGAEKWYGTHL